MAQEFNPTKIVYGDAGVLIMPDLDIQRPLYSKTSRQHSGQDIVDAENSAYYYKQNNYCDYISDHAHQEFDKIKKSNINTLAYVLTPNSTQMYYLAAITTGFRRKDGHIYTYWGQALLKIKWADLCVYTCNNTQGTEVTMLFFKKGLRLNYPIYK